MIHCSYGNHYKPIGSLQKLFEELVIQQPYKDNLQPTLARAGYEPNDQRVDILKSGRADFTLPCERFIDGFGRFYLTAENQVSIYCVHYMPMHLFSSYHIFTDLPLPLASDKTMFIDFGCGPLTSGIAWFFAKRLSDTIYVGIDRASAMLAKASAINEYGPDSSRPFFRRFDLSPAYTQLLQLLDGYIRTGDKSHIILNFCYFLASRTLNIEGIM